MEVLLSVWEAAMDSASLKTMSTMLLTRKQGARQLGGHNMKLRQER